MSEQRTRIYFASDLHLGSSFFEDTRLVEKRFVRWLSRIEADAKALYLLGDIFDYWFEYKHVVPKGFTRFLGKIARLSDQGVEVHFFTGNHDVWFFGYLSQELGVHIHTDTCITELYGKKLFLAHGDGVGKRDWLFRLIRSMFGSRLLQKMYAAIHPRWSTAFAHKWSAHSRQKGMDVFSTGFQGEDKEPLVLFAKDYLQHDSSIDYFVFGHRHILLDLMLSKKSRILILGDWLRLYSYAVLEADGSMSLEVFEETTPNIL